MSAKLKHKLKGVVLMCPILHLIFLFLCFQDAGLNHSSAAPAAAQAPPKVNLECVINQGVRDQ